MIKSFRDKETEKVFHRRFSRRLPPELQRVARRKLIILDAAERLDDLTVPPGNRFEELSGDRAGQHSIRTSDRWQVCFVWVEGHTYEVEIVDEREYAPIHPGEILLEELLKPMGLSQYPIAKDIGVWMNLQVRYDLEREKERLGERLTREVRVLAAEGHRA